MICHGGNNTVTEALWAGVPLLVSPFSTDQFAGAEDVRRAGVGDVFDPNTTAPEEIASRALRVLAGPAPQRAATLAFTLRERFGPRHASRLVERAGGGCASFALAARGALSRMAYEDDEDPIDGTRTLLLACDAARLTA